jgi:tRNA A37 methylthiotransferase MiaB
VVAETGLFAEKDSPSGLSETVLPSRRPPTLRQEGCDNRCSYCTSCPSALAQQNHGKITDEFRSLLDSGFKEFTIIGQDITSYGRDRGSDIREVLRRLLDVLAITSCGFSICIPRS